MDQKQIDELRKAISTSNGARPHYKEWEKSSKIVMALTDPDLGVEPEIKTKLAPLFPEAMHKMQEIELEWSDLESKVKNELKTMGEKYNLEESSTGLGRGEDCFTVCY